MHRWCWTRCFSFAIVSKRTVTRTKRNSEGARVHEVHDNFPMLKTVVYLVIAACLFVPAVLQGQSGGTRDGDAGSGSERTSSRSPRSDNPLHPADKFLDRIDKECVEKRDRPVTTPSCSAKPKPKPVVDDRPCIHADSEFLSRSTSRRASRDLSKDPARRRGRHALSIGRGRSPARDSDRCKDWQEQMDVLIRNRSAFHKDSLKILKRAGRPLSLAELLESLRHMGRPRRDTGMTVRMRRRPPCSLSLSSR